MRRYDEPIEVRSGEVGGDVGPAQFLWRRRLLKVLSIQTCWKETSDWWSRPSGDQLAETDLLTETRVWRVVAASGRSSEPGVYELACTAGGPDWLLRAVVD